jgi:hypothetical protein
MNSAFPGLTVDLPKVPREHRDYSDLAGGLAAQTRSLASKQALLMASGSRAASQGSLLDQTAPQITAALLGLDRLATLSARQATDPMLLTEAVRLLVEQDRVSAARALITHQDSIGSPREDAAAWAKVLAEPHAATRTDGGWDHTADYEWLSEHEDAYRGYWVALRGGVLIAKAESFKDLLQALGPEKRAIGTLVHKIR